MFPACPDIAARWPYHLVPLDSAELLAYECASRDQLRKHSRAYGSSKNLFYCFRRFDNHWRDCRIPKGRQRGVDHCRVNHWSTTTCCCIPASRTSRNRAGNGIHNLAFTRRAVCPKIHTDRKNHARRDDVDPKFDRAHRGHCRLGKKVIAWEKFVCGRGGGWCW